MRCMSFLLALSVALWNGYVRFALGADSRSASRLTRSSPRLRGSVALTDNSRRRTIPSAAEGITQVLAGRRCGGREWKAGSRSPGIWGSNQFRKHLHSRFNSGFIRAIPFNKSRGGFLEISNALIAASNCGSRRHISWTIGYRAGKRCSCKKLACAGHSQPANSEADRRAATDGMERAAQNGRRMEADRRSRRAGDIKNLPGLRERMKVKVEKTTIDGVRAFIVTPDTIAPENRNRVLIHMHGGCYVLSPWRGGASGSGHDGGLRRV